MNNYLIRKLAAVAGVLLLAAACSLAQAQSPIQPSTERGNAPIAAQTLASAKLLNLSGKYLGREDELCENSNAAMAVDHLSFDYQINGLSLAGALLVNCDTPQCQSGLPLATVTECPIPPSPCEAGIRKKVEQGTVPACMKGDPAGAGTVEVLAIEPWETSGTYTVMAFFLETGERSNTVSTQVNRIKNLSDSSLLLHP